MKYNDIINVLINTRAPRTTLGHIKYASGATQKYCKRVLKEVVAELKHKQKEIKSLHKQTQNIIKKAHDIGGDVANDMPWAPIIEVSPQTLDAVEKIENEHEGERIAAQIPEITGGDIDLLPEPEPENVRPIFSTEVERFYYLLERDELSTDDQEFFDTYKKTDMGRQIMQGQPEQAAEGGANV